MKIYFLGTGTSCGVPLLGCSCEVCRSTDPHDNRLRTSLMVESSEGERLLIDCGPDFRLQMLKYLQHLSISDVSELSLKGVLITHAHYDHIAGLDDLRPFSRYSPITIYGEEGTLKSIYKHYPYCFDVSNTKQFVPHFKTQNVSLHETFQIGSMTITPIRLLHGALPTIGYRINDIAYLTDLKTLPNTELEFLKGLKVLILDAVNWEKAHNTHENVLEAIALSRRIAADKTYLVHMSHKAGKQERAIQLLPKSVYFAYDGEEVDI